MINYVLMLMAIHWLYNGELSPMNYYAEFKTDQIIFEGIKRWEEQKE